MKPSVEVKIAIPDLTGQFVALEEFAWRLLRIPFHPILGNAGLNSKFIKDLNFRLGIEALQATSDLCIYLVLNAHRGLQTFY